MHARVPATRPFEPRSLHAGDWDRVRDAERFAALKFWEAAPVAGVRLDWVAPGDDPPDFILGLGAKRVGLEVKSLGDAIVRSTNAWLADDVHQFLAALQLPGEICYEVLAPAKFSRHQLEEKLEAAVADMRGQGASAPGARCCRVEVDGRSILRLTWEPNRVQRGPCVVRNSVIRVLDHRTLPELHEFLRGFVDAADARYAGASSPDAMPWWLLFHDEGDVMTTPLFGSEFRDFLAGNDPITCHVFNRVFVLGSYSGEHLSYPLLEIPLRSSSSSSP